MSADPHRLKAAVHAIFRDGDKILFVRRAHTGFMDDKLGMPAGHLERNESLEEGLAREVREEVGVEVVPESLKLVFTGHRYEPNSELDYINLYFEVGEWTGEFVNAEPEKHSELKWATLDGPDARDIIDYNLMDLKSMANGGNYISVEREDN